MWRSKDPAKATQNYHWEGMWAGVAAAERRMVRGCCTRAAMGLLLTGVGLCRIWARGADGWRLPKNIVLPLLFDKMEAAGFQLVCCIGDMKGNSGSNNNCGAVFVFHQ